MPFPVEYCRSKRLRRASPWYTATLMRETVFGPPRSSWIHAPLPLPDQRVARLPSTTLAGRFPSFVLAVTAEPAGVISVNDCAVDDEAPAARTRADPRIVMRCMSPPAVGA